MVTLFQGIPTTEASVRKIDRHSHNRQKGKRQKCQQEQKMILWCFVFDTSMNISSWYQTRFPDSIADGSGSRAQYPYTWIFFFSIHSTANRARWFLWNVSAISHMTSVTKRNIDPTGKVGDCSYTLHNHQPLGWIFFTRQKMWFFLFFYFFRKHCLHKLLNLHQLPNGAYRCYNCVTHILPTPCTSLTYVAEKWPK